MKKLLIIAGFASVTCFFAGCVELPTPPPSAQALPPSSSPPKVTLSKSANLQNKAGRETVLAIEIPSGNPAAQRFSDIYIRAYVAGYAFEWNKKIADRQILYRAYNGVFKTPAAESNFRLYDGERFSAETTNRVTADLKTVTDGYKNTSDAFQLSDQTTASRTGREDGQLKARENFTSTLLSQEK